jgi:hypothetical protein
MMAGDLEKKLLQSLGKAFETLSFKEVLPAEEPETFSTSGWFMAEVEILSPVPGKVALYLPLHLARLLVLEMFSLDAKEVPQNLIEDCLGEYVNTIAGCLLGDLLGRNQLFNLGLPRAELLDFFPVDQLRQNGFFKMFQIDENFLAVRIEGDILSRFQGAFR